MIYQGLRVRAYNVRDNITNLKGHIKTDVDFEMKRATASVMERLNFEIK